MRVFPLIRSHPRCSRRSRLAAAQASCTSCSASDSVWLTSNTVPMMNPGLASSSSDSACAFSSCRAEVAHQIIIPCSPCLTMRPFFFHCWNPPTSVTPSRWKAIRHWLCIESVWPSTVVTRTFSDRALRSSSVMASIFLHISRNRARRASTTARNAGGSFLRAIFTPPSAKARFPCHRQLGRLFHREVCQVCQHIFRTGTVPDRPIHCLHYRGYRCADRRSSPRLRSCCKYSKHSPWHTCHRWRDAFGDLSEVASSGAFSLLV